MARSSKDYADDSARKGASLLVDIIATPLR
jgi:hypothetical protein